MYFILNLDIKKKLFLDMTFLYNQTHDSTQYYYEYKHSEFVVCRFVILQWQQTGFSCLKNFSLSILQTIFIF